MSGNGRFVRNRFSRRLSRVRRLERTYASEYRLFVIRLVFLRVEQGRYQPFDDRFETFDRSRTVLSGHGVQPRVLPDGLERRGRRKLTSRFAVRIHPWARRRTRRGPVTSPQKLARFAKSLAQPRRYDRRSRKPQPQDPGHVMDEIHGRIRGRHRLAEPGNGNGQQQVDRRGRRPCPHVHDPGVRRHGIAPEKRRAPLLRKRLTYGNSQNAS